MTGTLFSMRPQTDNYPEELEQVVLALLSDGREAAAELLAPIAHPRREVDVRTEPSETIVVSVYKRDRFHCRYCGCRVIPTQIMRLISELFPDEFPYHSNWKGGQTHPAIASRSPSLDHLVPWSQGGSNELENLVCACWVCNQIKGDLSLEQLGWDLLPIPETDWDGLTRHYRLLWEAAESPTKGGLSFWLRRYDATPAADTGPQAS
jgi:5-methylcytosine-specific restriction endonuclease McrA